MPIELWKRPVHICLQIEKKVARKLCTSFSSTTCVPPQRGHIASRRQRAMLLPEEVTIPCICLVTVMGSAITHLI
jgi:hypothetical protein